MKDYLIRMLGGLTKHQFQEMRDNGCKKLADALVKAGIVVWFDGNNLIVEDATK